MDQWVSIGELHVKIEIDSQQILNINSVLKSEYSDPWVIVYTVT